jgi:hypothetical protein
MQSRFVLFLGLAARFGASLFQAQPALDQAWRFATLTNKKL